MPKKNDLDGTKNARPGRSERMPPPLSMDLIAKLQAAVEAEQRKRLRQPRADADAETDE